MSGRAWVGRLVAALAGAVCLAVGASAEVARPGRLLAAASPDHLWWIEKGEDDWLLWHSSPLSEEPAGVPVRRIAARFGSSPEALAAREDRVWLLFPPESRDGVARREALTLSTRRNPAVGHWFTLPAHGAELLPSLETPLLAAGGASAAGEALGFAAGPDGPWALLAGGPADRLGVRLARPAGDAFAPRLARLGPRGWESWPLDPALVTEGATLVTLASGAVALVGADPERPASRLVRRELVDGGPGPAGWIGVSPRAFEAWLVVDGRDALAARTEDAIVLHHLRPASGSDGAIATLLAWTTVPMPAVPWAVVGERRGAVVLAVSGAVAERRRVGPLDAEARVDPLGEPGFGASSWIHLPLLAALVLATLMALAFLRALRDERSDAPDATTPPPLPLPRRAVALLVDWLPGAVAAGIVFGVGPRDLVRVPFTALDIDAALPAALAAALACLVGFLGEAISGRSPGKWVVGGMVTLRDGRPAGPIRLAARNLLKLLVLLAPPLAFVTLFSPTGRGVPELLSGTAVTDRRAAAPAGPA